MRIDGTNSPSFFRKRIVTALTLKFNTPIYFYLTKKNQFFSTELMADTATSECCKIHDYLKVNEGKYYGEEFGDEPYLFRCFAINERNVETDQFPLQDFKFILSDFTSQDKKPIAKKRKRLVKS